MKLRFPEDIHIFIVCGQIDTRKSFYGLTAIVIQTHKLDPSVLFLRKTKGPDEVDEMSEYIEQLLRWNPQVKKECSIY